MLPRSVKAKAVPMTGAIVRYHASTDSGKVVCTPASGTFFRIGKTRVRCTARANGRVTRRSFTVVVADTSPPRLGLPRSITSQAGSADGVAVTYVATSSDDLSGKSVAHCTPQSGSTFPVGSTTVDCTATDGGGNTTSGSFTVTVTQTESNQLALPPPVTVEATSDEGAVVRYPGSAGSSAVSCTPQSGSQLPLGVTTVSCRSGGASGTFQVSIVDTTPPQVSVPTDVSATATSPRGAAVSYAVAARDSVDGTIVPSCTPQSGATFAIGQTLVRCTISDSHGNERQRSFAVKVVDGPPKLDLPTTATAAAVNARGAQLTLDFTAKDAVDGRVDVQCGQPNQTFPIGRTTVTCTAKDTAGNTARGSLVVIVRDEAAPRITLPSGAVTANATGPRGGVATWNVSAADNVDGAVAVSCDRTSGDVFAIGDTQVTCSAHDRAGNIANGAFTVVVRDRAAPRITVPTDTVVAAADDKNGARVSFSVTATDAVDGTIPAACDPPPGSVFPLGQTTVSCSAKDAAGNAAQPASFTVAVRDLTPPRFDLPNSPFTAPTIDANGGPVQFTATAYDAVDGTLAAQCNPSSGETFPYGRTTVTCTATDNAGNKGTDSFVVRLVDTEAPTLYLPPSPVFGCTCDWPYTGGYISWSASGSDNVDGSVDVTCTPASGSYFLLGDTVVSCSATDSSGNTTIGTFVVTIEPD
jgi:large repetitive protein